MAQRRSTPPSQVIIYLKKKKSGRSQRRPETAMKRSLRLGEAARSEAPAAVTAFLEVKHRLAALNLLRGHPRLLVASVTTC